MTKSNAQSHDINGQQRLTVIFLTCYSHFQMYIENGGLNLVLIYYS